MVPTFIQDTGAILDAFAAFEHFSDLFVRLELLEFLVRVKIGILVIEADNVTQVNQVWLHMVHK